MRQNKLLSVKSGESERQLHFVVFPDDGAFVARCLDVEVASDGPTEAEAVANLQEALALYFETNELPKMMKTVKDVLAAEATAILNIPETNPFTACVDLFLSARQAGGKLVIAGVGKAGEIGKKMAVTFCSVGLPTVFLHPLEAQHGDLGLLTENDILFLISNSGQTREVIELEILAKRLVPALKIVALTGKNVSELAKIADYVLWTGDPDEVCPLGLTPTTSTTVMSVIGDVLAVLLVQASGYTAGDYALRHHSGYLGEKSRK